MRNIVLFITVLTIVVWVGCSDGKIATIHVTGTVTFDGKPLDGASLNFSPKVQGQGNPAFGSTDASGLYKLQTILGNPDAGTTPGEYEVTIVKMEKLPPSVSSTQGSMIPTTIPKSLIPERYSRTSTSGLTATVKQGEKNVFNFDLTR